MPGYANYNAPYHPLRCLELFIEVMEYTPYSKQLMAIAVTFIGNPLKSSLSHLPGLSQDC